MTIIASKDNQAVKQVKRYHQKKYRKTHYLIEGFHLYEEAVRSGARITEVFVTPTYSQAYPKAKVVTDAVMTYMADSQTPQGILAVVAKQDQALPMGKLLVLDGVQDPGNIGTMIRTADAAGFDGVALGQGTGDIYNPKVMRSMQGSHFHLPVVQVQLSELYTGLAQKGVPIYASSLSKTSLSYRQVAYPDQFALVVGNEGKGISVLSQEQAQSLIHIDMPGDAESLNVAVAAGILMFNAIQA